ncbi:MAG: trigger factor [Candidatus Omnitrophota bacterium]
MKSKMRKLDGTAREFNVEMSKERVEETFKCIFEEIKKTAKIPGFREGNAPIDIIKKAYSGEALDEMKKRLIPDAYQEVLKEHDINPVSYPEIYDVVLTSGGELTFTVKVDVYPKIELKKYKGFKVFAVKVKVTDDEVNESIEKLQRLHAEFADVERSVEKGDFAVCDVEVFSEGRIISKKRQDMWIEADKEVSLLGVGDKLCGMAKGEAKDIEVTLPENYPDKKYAGKKASFRVEVKSVKEKKLLEAGDELAKKIGKQNIDEAREEIKARLLFKKEANVRVEIKNQIMEQLLKKHLIECPVSMVERQLKVLLERAENELKQKGVDQNTIDSHKEKMKDTLRKEAENKVKLYFILDNIADKEKITVSEAEVDEWIKALAESYGQDVQAVKKYYKEHNLIDGLMEQLREEKTLDFLLSESIVEEKK